MGNSLVRSLSCQPYEMVNHIGPESNNRPSWHPPPWRRTQLERSGHSGSPQQYALPVSWQPYGPLELDWVS